MSVGVLVRFSSVSRVTVRVDAISGSPVGASCIDIHSICIIIYSRFGSRLLAGPLPRSPPACGGLPVLARPRLGLGARGLRRGAHANSVVIVVVVVPKVSACARRTARPGAAPSGPRRPRLTPRRPRQLCCNRHNRRRRHRRRRSLPRAPAWRMHKNLLDCLP